MNVIRKNQLHIYRLNEQEKSPRRNHSRNNSNSIHFRVELYINVQFTDIITYIPKISKTLGEWDN